jgi:hypothetical protein
MINIRLQRRMTTAILFLIACGLGLYSVNLFAEGGPYALMMAFVLAMTVVWVFFAGSRWWLLMPPAVTFGGFFFFDFKLYLHEVTLPLCLIALLPAIAMGRITSQSNRPRLPLSAWILLAILAADWLVSYFALNLQGLEGVGSMSRVYFRSGWALVFLIVFRRYGDTRYLRAAFVLMYVACILRVISALLGFFAEGLLHLPVLNFIFSGSLAGIADFRFSGLQLLLLGLCFMHLSRKKLLKVFHLLMSGVACGLILMGGGRVSVGMLLAVPIFWAIIFRRVGALAVASGFLLVAVAVLNQQPQLVYRLPLPMQRAVSILVRESATGEGLDWHETVRSSNEWHRRLGQIGRERWTSSVPAFFFGTKAEPFDEGYQARAASIELKAQIAARMGLYESGLWTTLGLTGLCGLICYIVVFWFLLRQPALMLWREGLTSPTHMIALMAVTQCLLWTFFSWIAGGFPSQELLMAALARTAWDDRAARQPSPNPASDTIDDGAT